MSATFYQLKNPIYVNVVSKGNAFGRAIAWMCHGPEVSVLWCVLLENKEFWWVKNESVRGVENFSLDYCKEDSVKNPIVIKVPYGAQIPIDNLPEGVKIEYY